MIANFNLITGEWQMKWGQLENTSGQYNFEAFDYLVDFAESHGMKIHGHTLIWHEDIPNRIKNFNGTPTEFEQIMKNHIQTVVGRYKGRIQTWDVVNEAFDWTSYRDTIFYRMLGKDYISKAYLWAHEADPHAILYYNDYDMIKHPEKAQFVISELSKFINAGVPIHGIGEQAHMQVYTLNLTNIEITIGLFNNFGLPIRISELDMCVNHHGRYHAYTHSLADRQTEAYYQLVKKFGLLNNLTSITLWGFSDNASWLNYQKGYPEWPLLFDANYNPKPCAFGFLNALKEL
jgi:endo-1,4-beta-xylanase